MRVSSHATSPSWQEKLAADLARAQAKLKDYEEEALFGVLGKWWGVGRNYPKDTCGCFLKWGYPPNHPNLDHFSIETYGFGVPPF